MTTEPSIEHPTEQTAFNQAKREILDIIRTLGEVTSMDIALLANKTPEASAMNLLRYHNQGLLSRRKLRGKTRVYTITKRGQERLNWLHENYENE